MPRRCSVPSCRSNYRGKHSVGKYVSCYGFPSDVDTSKKWLVAIGRPNFVPYYDSVVCAKHFEKSSFVREDMYRGSNGELKVFKFAKPKLKNGAVPSLFLGLTRAGDAEKCASKEAKPVSTLDAQRKSEDAIRRRHFSEIDDSKSCMDFVEVEMMEPDNEQNTSGIILDQNQCDSTFVRKGRLENGICETRGPECYNSHRAISTRSGVLKSKNVYPPVTLVQRSPSCVFDDKGSQFTRGGNVQNPPLDLEPSIGTPTRAGIGIRDSGVVMNGGNPGTNRHHQGTIQTAGGEEGILDGIGLVTKKDDKCASQEETVKLAVNRRKDKDKASGDFQANNDQNCKALPKHVTITSSNHGFYVGKGIEKNEIRRNDEMDANSRQSGTGDEKYQPGDCGVMVEGGENRKFPKNIREVRAQSCDSEDRRICGENGVRSKETCQSEISLVNCSSGDFDQNHHGFPKNRKIKNRDVEGIRVCGENGVGAKEEEAVDLVLIARRCDRRKNLGVPGEDSELKASGRNRGSDKSKDGEDEGPCDVQEWEGGWIVKEELFRGLGLVPRGVLHDQTVDRRHCVSAQRRVETTKRFQTKTAVFYPPGTAMFDTEKFIGEIQRRPAIYDVRSKVYSNRVAKLKYWHEVGKEMYKGWDILDQMERRTLVKELQIKWKSIRDHFMRQLKQNMNGEGPKKKKYVHFDQLQFLTANLGVKRPRHSYKPPKHEPGEEYMELTPELPEERHFSFMASVDRPDYDEHEVPVAAALLPQQPEDLSYHPKDLSYHNHQELSYHKELEGDRMGNKMFLLSLLPIMERLPDHSNIRARLQLMEVLQTFVAHEDTSHGVFYNYQDEKRSCGDISQQHSTASHTDSDT